MTEQKYNSEIDTLKKFFELFCKDKHTNLKSRNINLKYKTSSFSLDLYLCDECFEAINYSFDRLQACPHEIKPRCRNCSNPCYEKSKWKNIAKIMKYSAIKLSLSKIKNRVLNIFS
ncbi:nitrous oxide-stimulated promoter family protein [Aliarcobacter butzleri]|uniref:nitrous oxide-stimulated promoter family protein n=1 Tax=Aliarcobacter butzleri TaxID=28197 RepID=UPI00215B5B57|nr:nitrous oxide-stimulated promoter family protein [Aliarcobacter butzleri]MCR8711061.1 nitrous oxide-stimulated promoter family protein [Aliarcobacter butzleri]